MTKIQDTSGQDRTITRKGRGRWPLYLVLALILGIAATLGFSSKLGSMFKADQSFDKERLRYATVTRGELVRDLSVQGRVVASSYPTLYSPARGTITMGVKAGDAVPVNHLLASIDSPELANLLKQEESEVAAADAALSRGRISAKTENLRNKQDVELKKLRQATAERELVRQQETFKQGLTNKQDLDKAHDELAIAKLEYAHAQQTTQLEQETQGLQVRNQEKQLERRQLVMQDVARQVSELEIRSPVSGVVGSVSVDPKDIVARNQELMTVIDLSAFETSISIPENYADEIAIGMKAEITYEGTIFAGLVTSVSPQVENAVVEGRVAFVGDLPHGLKQNQRVTTRLILSSLQDVLTVRRGPFLESGRGRKAWRVVDSLASLQPISIGASSLTQVQVVSGLKEGDVIVISDTTRFQSAETVYLRD